MDKAIAKIDHVLVLRLCRGEDIVGSIRAACDEYDIRAASGLRAMNTTSGQHVS